MARSRSDASWEKYGLTPDDSSGAHRGSVLASVAALRALATLSRGNEVLVRATGEVELLQQMCDAIVAAGQYPLVWYGRPLDDAAQTLRPVAVAGAESAYLDEVVISWGDGPLGHGPSGVAMRTRTAQVRDDLTTDPFFAPWLERVSRHGLRCSLTLPVVVGGVVDGVLAVNAAEPGTFDDVATELLADLAADIGVGLERLRDTAALEQDQRDAVAAAERLRATIDSLLDPFALLESVRDSDGRLVDLCYAEVNRAAVDYNRRPREELIGATMLELFPGLLEHGPLASYFAAVETGVPMVLDDVAYANEVLGEVRRYEVRGVKNGDGLALTWRDVTDRHAEREAREASEGLFRKAMQSASIGMAVAAIDGEIRLVNPALCSMIDRRAEWLCSHSLVDIVHPDDRDAVLSDRAGLLEGDSESWVSQARLMRGDGTSIWVRRTAVLVRDAGGAPESFVLQIEDVTAERRARDQLAFQAFHDPLTGLRNRAWIVDMLESDLLQARRAGLTVGVLYVDLDNFKVVNESLGHVAGDEMLATVARRIASALPSDLRIGRFGGDEFLVVIPEADGVHDVEAVAERVVNAVAEPLVVSGHTVVTSASIGVALSNDRSTPESLLRDADSAAYRAKSSGRARWHFFDDEMHAQAVQRLTVEDDLRRALETDELTAYYQPLVDLSDRRVVGHEALVRWVHPEKGVLTPYAFLTVAEESGLVVELGQQVLEAVCARIASTPSLPGTVSVNVSAVQLRRRDWADGFLETVRSHGVDPHRLVIEVTETAVLSLLDSVHDDLVALRGLGVGLHVDDFGTGYSSIALLRDLPVTGLKLDRSFVSALTADDSQANALSSGLAALARSLHLHGVAEGVETEEQAEILRLHGWPLGQGYLFGRPEPDPIVR
jgi:diguanylate cyclase (GGDEF)-like protein/PAS domain S-box-containing protein